jgi:hypothetical protein
VPRNTGVPPRISGSTVMRSLEFMNHFAVIMLLVDYDEQENVRRGKKSRRDEMFIDLNT